PNELVAVGGIEVHTRDQRYVGMFEHGRRIVDRVAVVGQQLFGRLGVVVKRAVGRGGIAPTQPVDIVEEELSGAGEFGDVGIGFGVGVGAKGLDSGILTGRRWAQRNRA